MNAWVIISLLSSFLGHIIAQLLPIISITVYGPTPAPGASIVIIADKQGGGISRNGVLTIVYKNWEL